MTDFTSLFSKEPLSKSSDCTPAPCQVCGGLECLCRPRFYPGQLLTEEDLNHLEHYIIAKNKLHNRYVHGWGVVCGLEVVCDECEGWVTVKPGYALDPCGNDIIVCEAHHFPVIEAIWECREAARRRRRDECDPLRDWQDEQCKDVEEHWCLAIEYREREVRPVPALRRDASADPSRCHSASQSLVSSGRSSSSSQLRSRGGCGCQSTQEVRPPSRCSSTVRPGERERAVLLCEPTRILEGYQLQALRASGEPGKDLIAALKGTFPHRVAMCFQEILQFLIWRASWPVLFTTFNHMFANVSAQANIANNMHKASSLHKDFSTLLRAVKDLYLENPFNVRCALVDLLKHLDVPLVPQEDMNRAQFINYANALQEVGYNAYALILQYFLDCLCMALLPPCPPAPADNRLILACLTIREDKIIHICNFFPRQYAGTFTSFSYWLPVGPVLLFLLRFLCCEKNWLHRESPLVNEFADLLDKIDPDKKLRQTLAADDFALPKHYLGKLTDLGKRLSPANLTEMIRPGEVNLAQMVGKSKREVAAACKPFGVQPAWRTVESLDDIPARHLLASPFTSRDVPVIFYTLKDEKTVVGFAPYGIKEAVADKQEELAALKRQVKGLRAAVSKLKMPGGEPKAR